MESSHSHESEAMREIARAPEFAEIVARYPKLVTQQERAIAEARLCAMATPGEIHGRHHAKSSWLRQQLGDLSTYELGLRAQLFNSDVQELWDRIDRENMSLGTAIRLLRQSVQKSRFSGLPLRHVVQTALVEHDQISTTIRTRSGGIARRHTAADRMRAAPTAERTDAKGKPAVNAGGKGGWKRLREVIAEVIQERAVDVSAWGQRELFEHLEADIVAAISSFEQKARRLRDTAPAEISRKAVLDACGILQTPPPRPGQAANLVVAKRQKHRLIRVVHPDSGGHGDGGDVRIITEAYDLLERYNSRFDEGTTTPEKKERNDDD